MLESQRVELEVNRLKTDVERINQFLSRYREEIVSVPIGPGFRKRMRLIAETLGPEPEEETGASGTFLATWDEETMAVEVTAGSYQVVNTCTDVDATEGVGDRVYAKITQSSAGVFESFEISIETAERVPVELDATETFAATIHFLLAEVVTDADGNKSMVQRRVGNLTLVHQIIDGHICLWPLSVGGAA